jgi:hypothetical protein
MKAEENNEFQITSTLNTVLIQEPKYITSIKHNKKKNKKNKNICCYNCVIIYYILYFTIIMCAILALLCFNKPKSYYQYDYYFVPTYY